VAQENRIRLNLENARLLAEGNYSGLLCSKCGKRSVEAYFTKHNLKDLYGIWFECENCGNVEHISCNAKPDGYTPLRSSDRFQSLDERAWDA